MDENINSHPKMDPTSIQHRVDGWKPPVLIQMWTPRREVPNPSPPSFPFPSCPPSLANLARRVLACKSRDAPNEGITLAAISDHFAISVSFDSISPLSHNESLCLSLPHSLSLSPSFVSCILRLCRWQLKFSLWLLWLSRESSVHASIPLVVEEHPWLGMWVS